MYIQCHWILQRCIIIEKRILDFVQAPAISYDFVDGDADPINDQYDWHGTRCAGLVSAAKDGAACGVGVAYNAKFAGENEVVY